jgi:hypothetical protein
MLITENQNKAMWTKMLTEQFHVEDNEKLNWVSDYAQTHAMFEANLGAHAVATPAGVTPVTVPAGAPQGGPGVGPMYATPANTLGMGNIAAPSGPHGADGRGSSTAGINPSAFFNQTPGSGDIPVSTLPMALNVALMTIGLELVPTIPTKGPWALLSYMDFPYAGGKMGRRNEIAGLDGVGAGRENKPMYFKVLLPGTAIAKLRTVEKLVEDAQVEFTTAAGTVRGIFKGFGRMDGGLLVQVIDSKNAAADKDISINEAFSGANGLTALKVAGEDVIAKLDGKDEKFAKPDFAQTMVDFIDGFANFATGKKEPMTRAENETGTGNTIGLRLFSKWITVGSYEVTGAVTRQQLQDLPLYGVNAVSKIMEAMQNEITQSINARILEHVFRLGVTNALNLKNYQGVDLNLYMGTADKDFAQLPMNIKEYKDIFGNDLRATWGTIKNSEVNTSAENLHTRQRRIASRVLAASNLIQVTNRRGPANWVVTNTQVVTALQDCAQYVVAPMQNTFTQSVTANLYKAGTLAGLQVYVDPYMDWDDTRICVGRKGSGNEPGVVFMPYILADQMQLIAEGTMAPKMLVNSRYAIADIGFFPEKSFYTFTVSSDFGLL